MKTPFSESSSCISKVMWIFVFVVFSVQVHSAPGDLDPTFGDGGKVTTDFGFLAAANGVAIQPSDSKIVVVGERDYDIALARYNTDGSLDTSFGVGGKVVTDFFGSFESASSVIVQPDGKILAVGQVVIGSTSDFGLVRYNRNGRLDKSFGHKGKVITDFGGYDLATKVALQQDGKIVVVGEADGQNFGIARYHGNGNLDKSFGSGGKIVTDFGGVDEIARAVSIQQDGKILAAGFGGAINGTNFVLARYNNNGSLDDGFGENGKVITVFFSGGGSVAAGIAVQKNGDIIAAGDAQQISNDNFDFAMVRYNGNGQVDMGFGDSGKVLTDFFGFTDGANDIALMNKGDILLAGFAADNPSLNTSDFALARYRRNGILNANFGSWGKVTTDFGGYDRARAMVLQPNGKIVVVGITVEHDADGTTVGSSFALARYLSDAASHQSERDHNDAD